MLMRFYGGSGVGGSKNIRRTPAQTPSFNPVPCTGQYAVPTSGYGTVLGHSFNNTSPDYGVGANLSITLRNRAAQADQVRSQMEYPPVADALAAALYADADLRSSTRSMR